MLGVGIGGINVKTKTRRRHPPAPVSFTKLPKLKLHPLFIAVGIGYCFSGDLFLFLMSCVVALQQECAHAYAAAKLGYKLDSIILMPFGAVIDGDLQNISLQDEIAVATAGPLCNLVTAAFFAALWWFFPTAYAFTDTACQASLSIALVNLLPAYPLDGGRVLRCVLARKILKTTLREDVAERKAARICCIVTLLMAAVMGVLFVMGLFYGERQFSLFTFACFLAFSAFGNKNKTAVYAKMDISKRHSMQTGVEIKRVAILQTCSIKDTLKYVTKDNYLILDVYDEAENFLFSLPQNRLSAWLIKAPTPYTTLRELCDS